MQAASHRITDAKQPKEKVVALQQAVDRAMKRVTRSESEEEALKEAATQAFQAATDAEGETAEARKELTNVQAKLTAAKKELEAAKEAETSKSVKSGEELIVEGVRAMAQSSSEAGIASLLQRILDEIHSPQKKEDKKDEAVFSFGVQSGASLASLSTLPSSTAVGTAPISIGATVVGNANPAPMDGVNSVNAKRTLVQAVSTDGAAQQRHKDKSNLHRLLCVQLGRQC